MTKRPMTRHWVNPAALRTPNQDGMGSGHDLDCGCLQTEGLPRRAGAIVRLPKRITGRA